MTATIPVQPAFCDLLRDQIEAARDAALANDLIGERDLADWWRWRAEDLSRYLVDGSGDPGLHAA